MARYSAVPTVAQEETARRFRKEHPRLRARLSPVGAFSGFCSILVKGVTWPEGLPRLDQEGYVVLYDARGRWYRPGRSIDPPTNPKEQPRV